MRVFATLMAGVFLMAAAPAPDPYTYMEEIEGAKAMDFARAENARSLPQLQNDPRYPALYADALKIATATDRIANVYFAGDGALRDYWQDSTHVRGIWRTTDLASYRTGQPAFRTLIDLDELAKVEKANWVWHGADCLKPDDRLCLVELSDGGKDAASVREFDTQTGQFVPGGFTLPEGKHRYEWIDRDTLIVATEWAKGEVTGSGYPYIVKLVKRGQPLSAAREVFRGDAKDGGYGVSPIVLREPDGKVAAVLVQRPLDTFNAEHHLITDAGPKRLDLPTKASIQGYVAGRLAVSLEQAWAAKGFQEGDLVDFDLAAVKANPTALTGALVLRPTESQAIEQVATTRDRLVVALYDNVKGQVLSFRRAATGWTSTRLDLPKDSSISISSTSDTDDRLLVSVTGYLTPSTQWLADAASGQPVVLKTSPARFDASRHTVEQFWATSKDGTKVPYFVVRPKDLKFDGQAPTLLYAYGGFLVSQTPAYAATVGKLWLEKGGVYAVANIR
ncbi:MAG: S9 family peptidase, partial [Phenylobacterium sp.]